MKTAEPAAGEAVPAKPSDMAIALALKGLEGDIHALMHVSDIAAEALDGLFNGTHHVPDPEDDTGKLFRFTEHELDQFNYLVNDVALRCSLLQKQYLAAFRGEVRK